ncbi:MmpS family transport accessory protein [Mycolicibacterium pulveris]|uniref:MmpS family transport accessory protein n=1 Tax=Mycolicibacterium pulveris TaxID=36813 RepID=UPI003CEB5BE8
MTDSRRDGPDPSQPQGSGYGGYADPAYASQAGYGPTYQAPAGPAPTEQLTGYSPYGYDPYASGQYGPQYPSGGPPDEPPPEEPGAPRWLWVLAGVAVVTVVGLVVALVIVNVNRSRQETVVAPPSMQEPRFTPTSPTSPPRPTVPVVPAPTVPSTPPRTTTPPSPGVTETVVYDVTGTGRAINITYVDSGGLLQTEFNVLLPWSKQVELSEPAEGSASISIINVGREVSCSITVDGAVVQRRTGAGLTICTALG